MAITVELIKAEERESFWKLGVEYVDTDTGKASRDYFKFNGDDKSLKRYVINNLKVKEEVKSFDFETLLGTPIDITPDPVIPPTPPTDEEIAKSAWFDKLIKMERYQRLVNAKVMTGAETVISDLAAELIADFENSYFGSL